MLRVSTSILHCPESHAQTGSGKGLGYGLSTRLNYPIPDPEMTLLVKSGVLRYFQLSTSLLTVVVTQGVRGTQRTKL